MHQSNSRCATTSTVVLYSLLFLILSRAIHLISSTQSVGLVACPIWNQVVVFSLAYFMPRPSREPLDHRALY